MQIEFRENYKIKTHTTFKIGGGVNKVWLPKTQQELVFLLKELKDYMDMKSINHRKKKR